MANLTECFPVAEIIRCSNFAAAKHKNQRRKDPEKTPYINHPIGLCSKHMILSFHSFYFFVHESDTFRRASNPVRKMCKQAVFVQDPHTFMLLSTLQQICVFWQTESVATLKLVWASLLGNRSNIAQEHLLRPTLVVTIIIFSAIILLL